MKAYKKYRKNKFVDTYLYSKRFGNYNNKLMISFGVSQLVTFIMPLANEDYDNIMSILLRNVFTGLIFYEFFIDVDDKIKFKKSKQKLIQIEEMLKDKGYEISFDDEYFILPKKKSKGIALCYDDFIFDCTKKNINFIDADGNTLDITDDVNKIIKSKK